MKRMLQSVWRGLGLLADVLSAIELLAMLLLIAAGLLWCVFRLVASWF